VVNRRHFGTVRKRNSGKWQAMYWHDGERHAAGTFAAKADALAYLSTVEADLRRGAWINPRAGQVTLGAYAEEWLERRPDLAVRTRELYRYVLEVTYFHRSVTQPWRSLLHRRSEVGTLALLGLTPPPRPRPTDFSPPSCARRWSMASFSPRRAK
jgi:hypothetical protein